MSIFVYNARKVVDPTGPGFWSRWLLGLYGHAAGLDCGI